MSNYFYFGVWNKNEALAQYFDGIPPSHVLYRGNTRAGDSVMSEIPYAFRRWMDGGLVQETPGAIRVLPENRTEGKCYVHQSDGWTALAFWDRSGDPDFDSNSVF